MLANEPTLDEVKTWIRIGDDLDDDALTEGLRAAVDYQTRYLLPTTAGTYPDDLRQAAMLRAARYLARRSTPEGLLGMGELGAFQIATVDRDIRELEAPYMKPSVA